MATEVGLVMGRKQQHYTLEQRIDPVSTFATNAGQRERGQRIAASGTQHPSHRLPTMRDILFRTILAGQSLGRLS
jgi:hypothetical protein